MIKLPVIYLSGPIDGLTKEQATGWRNDVKRCYPFFEYRDPARCIFTEHFDNPKEVVLRDKADMAQSDIFLVNLVHYGAGTCMEILHGFNLSKMVLVVNSTGKKNEELSVWVRYHATDVFSTIHEAMTYIMKFYAEARNDNVQHFPA